MEGRQALACAIILACSCNTARACRWAAHASSAAAPPIAAEALFLGSDHSLAVQSHAEPFIPYARLSPLWDERKANIRNHLCNRDGWGISWLLSDGQLKTHRSPEAATTKGVPSDELRKVAAGATGRLILAHIRAATAGGSVEFNSHPFTFSGDGSDGGGSIAWMHNGGLSNLDDVLRAVLPRLPAHTREAVKGTTDSEVAGAVFVSHVEAVRHLGSLGSGAAVLGDAMRRTLVDLIEPLPHSHANFSGIHMHRHATPAPLGSFGPEACAGASSMNFAAADSSGNMVLTRFRNCDTENPPTLYIACGGGLPCGGLPACAYGEECALSQLPLGMYATSAVWAASEPLDKTNGGGGGGGGVGEPRWWALLPKDSMVEFDSEHGRLTVSCLSSACVTHAAATEPSGNRLPGLVGMAVYTAVLGVGLWAAAMAGVLRLFIPGRAAGRKVGGRGGEGTEERSLAAVVGGQPAVDSSSKSSGGAVQLVVGSPRRRVNGHWAITDRDE